LAVIDISDPTNPGTPVYGATSGAAWGVYVSGDYAYIGDRGSGLAVIQIRKRVDMVNPLITNAPSDFTVDYGYTGISISWTATDSNPNIYTIELQGSGVVAGPFAWSSSVAITYNVPNGLAVGEYFYTVNFTDDYNNYITDTVKMTVREVITDGNGGAISFGNYYLIFLVIGIISLVIVQKRRKQSSYH
ncbi:MAG: hypothetical protein KAW66_10670, partial [Candidatus Lokiarchaeota archaeon]|nr:hypothetical protein [Candidatus Lokiarchaeota archaeon]